MKNLQHSREAKLKSRFNAVANFYKQQGRMPSFSEIGEMLGLRSKNAVFKFVNRLEDMGVGERDHTGRLIPLSLVSGIRVLGTVEAGFPSAAEEGVADTLSFDDLLVENREATFLLKVSGDSMIEAGALTGGMGLEKRVTVPEG